MKNWSGIFQLLLCGIFICVIGCDPPNAKKQPYETLVFQVDASRLGTTVTDETLRIQFAPPKDWERIDDSTLSQVISAVDTAVTTPVLKLVPRSIFLNPSSQALCVVSGLKGVDITPNEALLQTLTEAYRDRFPEATVRQAVFMKDTFRVHQVMVSAADFVLIKLICDAPETLVFAVDYRIPKNVYQTQARSIESSIGSIHIHQE